MDDDLKALIETGLRQGNLTYDQVHACLGDGAVDPGRLDEILMALEEHGISVGDDPPFDPSE